MAETWSHFDCSHAPAMDEGIIQHRLLTMDATVHLSAPTLKRCLGDFVRMAVAPSVEDTDRAWEALEASLGQYEMMMEEQVAAARRSERELQFYAQTQTEARASRTTTADEIETLRTKLGAALAERAHKEEYEVIARRVNREPTRGELHRRKAEIEAAISALELDRDRLDTTINMRRKQLGVLFRSLRELQLLLADAALASGVGETRIGLASDETDVPSAAASGPEVDFGGDSEGADGSAHREGGEGGSGERESDAEEAGDDEGRGKRARAEDDEDDEKRDEDDDEDAPKRSPVPARTAEEAEAEARDDAEGDDERD